MIGANTADRFEAPTMSKSSGARRARYVIAVRVAHRAATEAALTAM